jgi:lysophospholipase L1-like esterase
MNKLLSGILWGIGAVGVSALIVKVVSSSTGSKGKLADSKKLIKKGRVLFIGDSYTDSPTSYADQLQLLFPSLYIKKIAKVGSKTDWMLDNAKMELKNRKYDAVFILGGINDIYATGSITNTEKNLEKIYQLAKDNGAKVIGVTIAPTDYYAPYTAQKGKLTEDLNKWILGNDTLDAAVDFNKILKGPDGKQNVALFSTDSTKLHASPTAHKMLAEQIKSDLFIQ